VCFEAVDRVVKKKSPKTVFYLRDTCCQQVWCDIHAAVSVSNWAVHDHCQCTSATSTVARLLCGSSKLITNTQYQQKRHTRFTEKWEKPVTQFIYQAVTRQNYKRACNCVWQKYALLQCYHTDIFVDFTFSFSLCVRLKISRNLGLRPKISQKVLSLFSSGLSDCSVHTLIWRTAQRSAEW